MSILLLGGDATQSNTTLVTSVFPATVTGLRWDLNWTQAAGTGHCEFTWVIVVVREGTTVDSITPSNGSTLYQPEQNVMSWGTGAIDNHQSTIQRVGATKTMRKLQLGDSLVFAAVGVATNTYAVRGGIQFFCMS